MPDKPKKKKIKVVKLPENKNEIIKKHNYLTKAKYRLSLHEARIYSWLISEIHKDDDDITIYEMPVLDFARRTGSKNKNPYKHAKDVTAKLIKRFISIEDIENGDEIQATLVASAKYLKNKGVVRLEISSQLKPYLIDLTRGQFTITYLPFVMSLKSVYSFRIYELLAQWRGAGGMTMEVQQIKETLGVETLKAYQRFDTFERKVLQVALAEVNEKTDVKFRYEKIKKGRSIHAIKFVITSGKKGSLRPPTSEIKEVIPKGNELTDVELLLANGVSKTKATNLVNKHPERVKNALLSLLNQKNLDNPAGYLVSFITENWSDTKTEEKQTQKEAEKQRLKQEAIREKAEREKKSRDDEYWKYVKATINGYISILSAEDEKGLRKEFRNIEGGILGGNEKFKTKSVWTYFMFTSRAKDFLSKQGVKFKTQEEYFDNM